MLNSLTIPTLLQSGIARELDFSAPETALFIFFPVVRIDLVEGTLVACRSRRAQMVLVASSPSSLHLSAMVFMITILAKTDVFTFFVMSITASCTEFATPLRVIPACPLDFDICACATLEHVSLAVLT